jgi:hypothetical protein
MTRGVEIPGCAVAKTIDSESSLAIFLSREFVSSRKLARANCVWFFIFQSFTNGQQVAISTTSATAKPVNVAKQALAKQWSFRLNLAKALSVGSGFQEDKWLRLGTVINRTPRRSGPLASVKAWVSKAEISGAQTAKRSRHPRASISASRQMRMIRLRTFSAPALL